MDFSSLGLIFPAPFAWGLHVKRCPLWYLKKVLMEVLQPSKSYHYILQMNNILNRFGYLDFWSGESPEPTFTSSMELALLFRRSSLFNIRKSIKIWRCLPSNPRVLQLQLLESPPQLIQFQCTWRTGRISSLLSDLMRQQSSLAATSIPPERIRAGPANFNCVVWKPCYIQQSTVLCTGCPERKGAKFHFH